MEIRKVIQQRLANDNEARRAKVCCDEKWKDYTVAKTSLAPASAEYFGKFCDYSDKIDKWDIDKMVMSTKAIAIRAAGIATSLAAFGGALFVAPALAPALFVGGAALGMGSIISGLVPIAMEKFYSNKLDNVLRKEGVSFTELDRARDKLIDASEALNQAEEIEKERKRAIKKQIKSERAYNYIMTATSMLGKKLAVSQLMGEQRIKYDEMIAEQYAPYQELADKFNEILGTTYTAEDVAGLSKKELKILEQNCEKRQEIANEL